jgi:hypothetical protein
MSYVGDMTTELANKHHTGDGKFADKTAERERILKIYQHQQLLPVTGILDEATKNRLSDGNRAAND